MVGHDIVVIGGSAGGVAALKRLCSALPGDLAASLFVVLHISPTSRSFLPELLSRSGKLPAHHAIDGEKIRRGWIYVPPPDLHMLVRAGHVILRRGPRENRTRPAIDPLFRSAAVTYRSRVIGVVLSGTLDDGAAGLTAVKLCGGTTVVQDPNDAMWPEMPRNALAHEHVDHIVAMSDLPALLVRLVGEAPGPMPPIPRNLILETKIAALETFMPAEQTELGRPIKVSGPQRGGVLNEVAEEGSAGLGCQIGPAVTADAVLAAQSDELGKALESAIRIHRDRGVMFRRMQHRSEAQAMPHAAARWRAGADESEHAAALIAQALTMLRPPSA